MKSILLLPLLLSVGTWLLSHHRKIEIISLFGPYCTQTFIIDGYISHDATADPDWSRPWINVRLTGKMAGLSALAGSNTSYWTTFKGRSPDFFLGRLGAISFTLPFWLLTIVCAIIASNVLIKFAPTDRTRQISQSDSLRPSGNSDGCL